MTALAEPATAGNAFDMIAESYDAQFTASLIGRAQRAVVWKKAAEVFGSGDRVLELNCGTGEDALFLARRGISVMACDASARMIERARIRKAMEAPKSSAEFEVLCSEHLGQLKSHHPFDGVLSNFSGLNCVADLSLIARLLSERLRPGAQLLLCVSTRFCVWEMLYYACRAEFRKAFRRCSGYTKAHLGEREVAVYYPTLRSMLASFGPGFRLRSVAGVGITVPPSYMETWASNNRLLFRMCERLDAWLCRCPGLRVLGDHMLLHMEKV